MAFLLLAGCIEAYQVAGYVLEFALGALLELVPRAGAEFVDFWWHTLLAAIFGQLVQGVYRHEDDVIVGIDELDHLLCAAVDIGAQQSGKPAHAVVDVHYVVARLDGTQLFERKREFARAGTVALECVFVETVKYLMVGKHTHLQPFVAEPFVEGRRHRGKRDVVAAVGEDGFQTFNLFLAVA